MEQTVNEAELNALFNQAVALEDAGDAEGALRLYRQCLAVRPLSTDVLNNLGVLLCKTGQVTEGIGCLRQAITLNPLDPDYWCSLGEQLLEQGHSDEALHSIRQALSIDPRHAEAVRLLKEAEPEPIAQAEPAVAEGVPTPKGPWSRGPMRIAFPRDSTFVERVQHVFQQSPFGSWLLLALVAAGAAYACYAFSNIGAHPHVYRPVVTAPAALTVPTYTVDEAQDQDWPLAELVYNQKWTPGQLDRILKVAKNHLVMASNSSHDKVGEAIINGEIHACVWHHDIIQDLGTAPGDHQSCAYGINDQGIIVGSSGTSQHRAMLWDGSQMYDLNTRAETNGLRLIEALYINDVGIIYARAKTVTQADKLVRVVPH